MLPFQADRVMRGFVDVFRWKHASPLAMLFPRVSCAGVQVQKRPSPEGNPSIVKDTHKSDASQKTNEVKGRMQWSARSTDAAAVSTAQVTPAAAASTASALPKLYDSFMLLWLPRTAGA